MLVAFDEHGLRARGDGDRGAAGRRRRRGIHVLVTISVPSTSPIDAALPEQEALAQSIIEEAKVQAGRRVSGHWEKVRRRADRRRIVDEARAMRAEAIVMPMAPAGSGLRPDARDRAARAAVPRDHRVRPRAEAKRRTPIAA